MGAHRKTVLVVEDHPPLRAAICRLLRQMGLESVEASDVATALGRLATAEPDLVFLDLVLPEGSGYELCELIRSSPRFRSTPILAASERAYPADRAHASEAGADAFIAKPFTVVQLRKRIESLLDRGPAALAS